MKLTKTRKFSLSISSLAVIIVMAAVIVNATVIEPFIARMAEREAFAAKMEAYRAMKRETFAAENAERKDYDVAFIGDSITDLYDVELFYPELVVTNRGIGGDTTFDLEGRLELSLIEIQPRVVVMLIGANNPESMFDNYERIMLTVMERLPECKLVLCSITPFKGPWRSRNEITVDNNRRIKQLADKYSITFVDYFTPMYDEENGEIYSHMTDDDIHPNEAGYKAMTEILSPIIYNLLELQYE